MWECKKFVLIVIFSLSLLGNCRADGFYFDCDLRGTVFLENSENYLSLKFPYHLCRNHRELGNTPTLNRRGLYIPKKVFWVFMATKYYKYTQEYMDRLIVVMNKNKIPALSFSGADVDDNILKRIEEIKNIKGLGLGLQHGFTSKGMEYINKVKTLQYLDLSSSCVTSKGIEKIKSLPKLKTLILSGCLGLTDAIMPHIGEMRQLEYLALPTRNEYMPRCLPRNYKSILARRPQITNNGLKFLCNLHRLKFLKLPRQIKDDGLVYLKDLKNLEILLLDNNPIDGSGLKSFREIPNLRVLDISLCNKLNWNNLKYLEKMKKLEWLKLNQCDLVTTQGVISLSRLQNLKRLELTFTPITDKELMYLCKLKNLEYLDIAYCHEITDNGIDMLHKLKNLKYLNLVFCKRITKAAVFRLKSNLRWTEIKWKPNY